MVDTPSTTPDPSPVPAAEPEPTPQERLEALLTSIRANYEHNAPISPNHIKELEALVDLGRKDRPKSWKGSWTGDWDGGKSSSAPEAPPAPPADHKAP